MAFIYSEHLSHLFRVHPLRYSMTSVTTRHISRVGHFVTDILAFYYYVLCRLSTWCWTCVIIDSTRNICYLFSVALCICLLSCPSTLISCNLFFPPLLLLLRLRNLRYIWLQVSTAAYLPTKSRLSINDSLEYTFLFITGWIFIKVFHVVHKETRIFRHPNLHKRCSVKGNSAVVLCAILNYFESYKSVEMAWITFFLWWNKFWT